MFRATMCPSSGEITVSMRHLVFVTLCGCCIPDSHPHRVTNTKCRVDTVISPDVGHIVTRNMKRKEINIRRKIVHQGGFIYKIIACIIIILYVGLSLMYWPCFRKLNQASFELQTKPLFILDRNKNQICREVLLSIQNTECH